MPQAKSYLFSDSLQNFARIGKILSHPARVHIIQALRQKPAIPFEQLARSVPLHKSTFCQHLRLLKKDGFVQVVKYDNGHSGYSLNLLALEEALIAFEDFVSGEGLVME
ncbi:MAG: helix-turn-helix transcriptional regulator [Bacteroidota bacterium]